MNLIAALQEEIRRNREMVEIYRTVPNGEFAAVSMEFDIKNAEEAIANMDTVGMVRLLGIMRENTL